MCTAKKAEGVGAQDAALDDSSCPLKGLFCRREEEQDRSRQSGTQCAQNPRDTDADRGVHVMAAQVSSIHTYRLIVPCHRFSRWDGIQVSTVSNDRRLPGAAQQGNDSVTTY